MTMITAYFDGLCYPKNPCGIAAYGYTIYKDGELLHKGFRAVGEGSGMTNNVAEYEGLLAALSWIKDNGIDDKVVVRGDSQLVINQVSGRWQVKSRTSSKYVPEIKEIMKEMDVALEWIPREKNVEADELSRVAYERYKAKKSISSRKDVKKS